MLRAENLDQVFFLSPSLDQEDETFHKFRQKLTEVFEKHGVELLDLEDESPGANLIVADLGSLGPERALEVVEEFQNQPYLIVLCPKDNQETAERLLDFHQEARGLKPFLALFSYNPEEPEAFFEDIEDWLEDNRSAINLESFPQP